MMNRQTDSIIKSCIDLFSFMMCRYELFLLYYCFTAFSTEGHISSITILADVSILKLYLTSH